MELTFRKNKMISTRVRSTKFSILLLVLSIASVLNVHEVNGAKCTFSFTTGTAVCNNVNSFREVALEMRSTWINVNINNRLGGSFDMTVRGMKHTYTLSTHNTYIKNVKNLRSSLGL